MGTAIEHGAHRARARNEQLNKCLLCFARFEGDDDGATRSRDSYRVIMHLSEYLQSEYFDSKHVHSCAFYILGKGRFPFRQFLSALPPL